MNFIHKILVMAAILILGISCLIAGTYYGTRVTVNMRPKETETERTLRITTIKSYEPPSSHSRNGEDIGEENILEKEVTTLKEKKKTITTLKNRVTISKNKITTCGTSKLTSKSTSELTSVSISKKETTTFEEPTSAASSLEQTNNIFEEQE